VEVVERDFTPKGKMKPVSAADRKKLKGRLPFYSVDTKEEADALIEMALERGEFVRTDDGRLMEVTLIYEQTLDNLYLAGDRLAAIHEELKEQPCS
jgi:hypothetical protein